MTEAEPDYSDLPDLVWVEVMKRLPSVQDRLNLSYCCHALNTAFNHPALWHTVEISVTHDDDGGDYDRHTETKVMCVPKIYLYVVKKFSHCLRSLIFNVQGHTDKLPSGWKELFYELDFGKMLSLRQLTLNVRKTNVTDINDGPANRVISSLLKFLNNSATLKSLTIQTWPPGTVVNPQADVICPLALNKALKDRLESLSLFWLKNSDWVTKNGNVPSLAQTKVTINHLCALTDLSLRSSMLDSEAIEILAKSDRANLKRLNVLIIYSRHNDIIPEISSSSWSMLIQQSPKLEVQCSVMTRTPMMELGCLLKPEVPLVAMTFLKYSYCDADILYSLAEKYSSTLRKLIDFTDWGESDDAILTLVENCSALNYLVYHRSTHYTTIPHLVEARGAAWKQFEFKEKNIDTRDRDEDTDVVIGHNNSGGLYLKQTERFHEKKDIRERRLDSMIAVVRENVGFNWYPV